MKKVYIFIILLFSCFGCTKTKNNNIADSSYAASLHNKGNEEILNGNYKKAIEYTQKAVNLRKEILGDNNIEYIKSLSNLALCYAGLDDFNRAIDIEKEVLLKTKGRSELNEINAISTRLLGSYYNLLENHKEAIDLGIKACELSKDVFGENHSEYASSLCSLGDIYISIGNFDKALKLQEKACTIYSNNNNGYGLAWSSVNMAIICMNIENNDTAQKLLEKASQIYKQQGYMSDYYLTLNTLGVCYNKIGNYTKAILVAEEALNGFNKLYGKYHHRYATTLNTLAKSYSITGDVNKYLKYTSESLTIQEKVFGANNPHYAMGLINAAAMYATHIDLNEALEMNKKAIDILEANDMVNTLYYKQAVNNQIQYNINLRKYEEAISDINIILPQIEPESYLYADYLFKLSICYENFKDYDKAIKNNEESLKIIENIYGKSHLYYIRGLNSQIVYLYLSGAEEQLIQTIKEEAECISKFTQNNVLTFSSKERTSWWEKVRNFYCDLSNFVYVLNQPSDFVNLLYNGTLISKGILLNIDRGTKNAILELNDNTIHQQYEKLKLLKKQHSNSLKIDNKIKDQNIDDDIAILERELLNKVNKYIKLDNYSVNIDSIKSKLGPNDVAIEFMNFIDWFEEEDSMVYDAFIIKKDWTNARLVPIISEKLIKQQYFSPVDSIPEYALYKWIWGELESEKIIKPGDNIYFSASGILHQIPIESLPIGNEKIMSDVYNMHRLSSTRELVKKRKKVSYTKAALYGGLNYDMLDNDMLVESSTYINNTSEEHFASRGLLEDSIRGYKWDNLSNTLQEVNYISDLMNKNQITTQTYKGNKGNEESFKALSGQGYNIIHLATHGFFYPDEEAKEKDYFKPMMLNDNSMYNEVDMSMWRSGLVMSGGNRAWKGDTIPDTVEDGILKAQEIGDLDLRGADLVVLSACNTGQGEVTGEGVFGLQRAFKMAGAQTIVMSLTPVDDQTTMAMMNKFYTNLFSGQSKHDAFYNAQRYIRSIKPDPKYWMGWIMLD